MKKLTHFLVPLLIFALIVVSMGWYLFSYDREFTRDTLLSQARFQNQHGNSRLSSLFYNAAYSFSGHDENVATELANQYKKVGNYTKAELTLTQAIKDSPTVELYTALSKVFVEQDKLLDAVSLLDNVADPTIKAQLDAQRPAAPTSDFEPGYYSQYMDIHLLSDNAKYIFYSLDGEYPSIAGDVYNGSVTLPTGETHLRAIAVSDSGLVSTVASLDYTITGIIEQVTFADPAMESAIRALIGADADDKVYTNELWEITDFTAPENVKSFEDLALLPYLTSLTIQNSTLDSLEALTSLEKLVILDLSGSKFPVEDLSILATMPSLSSLTLSGCNLSTIEGLSGAENLTYLDLSNNTLRNLKVLTTMPALAEISLNHNAVTDLSDLSGLTNLVKLCLSHNSISNLSPLASCTRLAHLELDYNNLSSLNGLAGLENLSVLSVANNDLTDVSLLSGNVALTELNISSNDITDITALSTLTNLKTFDFSGNQVEALPQWPDGGVLTTIDGSYNALSDINSLKNQHQLTHVYMDYNLLTNIDALADCYCLVQVNVFGNTIADVSALRDRDIIVNYDPTAA